MSGSKYSEEQAAKDTGSSKSDVGKAWHDARDHAEKSGHLIRGKGNGISMRNSGNSVRHSNKNKS